jgi:hypothetical protein
MSQVKNISINPDDFHFAGKTKKKKPASDKPIRIKAPAKPNHNQTLKKRSILNMIRQHQDNYRKKFTDTVDVTAVPKPTEEVNFHNQFEKSKEYFEKMLETDKDEKRVNVHVNHTLKNYVRNNVAKPADIPMIDKSMSEMVNMEFPEGSTEQIRLKTDFPQAKYGCLKNGNLPTYRQYHNCTLKNIEASDNIVNNQQAKQEWKQMNELLNAQKNARQHKRVKQKKTVRRTFKTGKSKTTPNVCVLVSNKTIRNNITTKSHQLRQTPIADVKKYLVKHGFIRVGSGAPNDVLRKMYESANLICGEIKNHNEDNLLFNYLNTSE